MDPRSNFDSSVEAFVRLVARIPDDAWDRPALGVWDVRSLVGHTSRAVSTVVDGLAHPAAAAECESAAAYFAAARGAGPELHQAVAERGVQAGHDLGDEAAEVMAALAERVRVALDRAEDDAVVSTRLGAMRLPDYLQTRVVELVVHCSDIAAAVDLDPRLPSEAIEGALDTITRAALHTGRGLGAVRQLSGRDGSSFDLF